MMFCKRLVEMSHNRLSPLAIERLVKLNNCPFHRFCLFPVGEIMKDIYTKNETLKRQFLKFDILPGAQFFFSQCFFFVFLGIF